jgi:MFS family permease
MRTIRAIAAEHFGGLPARFWWLWAGAVVSAFATFVFLFLAVYLASRGFSAREVGLLVSADGLGSLAAAPIGGWLADRIGRRPTLLSALAATAAAAVFLGVVRAPALVVAGVLVFGLASAMIFPAMFAMVADLVPERDLERGFGLLYWAINFGVAFSAAVGGAIGERSWLALFLADAATTLVFAAVVWRWVPETRPECVTAPAPEEERAPSPARGYGAVLRDGPFVAFGVVFVVYALVFWQFQVAAPLTMTADGLGPGAIGRVLMVNGVVIFALQPFSARLVARLDPAHVLAAAAVLVGAGYGGYALSHGVASYGAATAVWSVGEVLTTPVASALVARMAPPDVRGRYQGAFAVAWGAGRTLAPALGGAALQSVGPAALWTGCFAVSLVAAAGHLAVGAWRRRVAASLSTR